MEQYNKKNQITKKLTDFLYEEEGNISRGKILTIGSLLLIAGLMFADDLWATHRSHSSHSSHRSHSSGSGGHYSHVSHESHTSHSSGSSHSSHSSSSHNNLGTTPHSNSSHSNVSEPAHSNVAPVVPDFNTPQTPNSTPNP